MTIRAHYDEPCWEIVRVATGEPPEAEGGDGWAHYRTEVEARADLAERQADYEDESLTVAQSFPGPCVGLFCDGPDCAVKDEPLDCSGEGWTHLDPADPTPFDLDDIDVFEWRGKHYCGGCWPDWCDDCDERHPEGECDLVKPEPSRLLTTPDGTVLDTSLPGIDGDLWGEK